MTPLHNDRNCTHPVARQNCIYCDVDNHKHEPYVGTPRNISQITKICVKPIFYSDKVLVLLLTDTNKFLLQWEGPCIVTMVVHNYSPKDYKVPVKGKEKTLHANLPKKYVVREDSIIDNVVPAVQDDHRKNIPSGVAVVENYEPDANAQRADGPSADVPSVEDLPEIGGGRRSLLLI